MQYFSNAGYENRLVELLLILQFTENTLQAYASNVDAFKGHFQKWFWIGITPQWAEKIRDVEVSGANPQWAVKVR